MNNNKKKPTEKLKQGDCTLQVEQPAYIKSLVLQAHTKLEWSGYGPIISNGNGKLKLLDFYYLSEGDLGAETNLSPEATAQAWMNVVESGIDLDGVQLAWVHCHPWGGGFWSPTDERAIKDLTTRNGVGIAQVSVLFHGNGVMARIDELGKMSESLKIELDLSQYEADIARAAKAEAVYRDDMIKKQRELAIKRAEELEAERRVKGQPALPGFQEESIPWFLLDEYEVPDGAIEDFQTWLDRTERPEDEEVATWRYPCEICTQEVEVECVSIPKCLSCGGMMCPACRSKIFPNVCMECSFDVANVDEMAKRMGPVGYCFLCEDPIERGEVYCDTCGPLFQDVQSPVSGYC